MLQHGHNLDGEWEAYHACWWKKLNIITEATILYIRVKLCSITIVPIHLLRVTGRLRKCSGNADDRVNADDRGNAENRRKIEGMLRIAGRLREC